MMRIGMLIAVIAAVTLCDTAYSQSDEDDGKIRRIKYVQEHWNILKHADKSYQLLAALESKTPEGKFDYYYQLVLENFWRKGPQPEDCGQSRGFRRRTILNSTVADFVELSGAKDDKVQNLPIFTFGVGTDPVTGKRSDGCTARPAVTQFWKPIRYEVGEKYTLKLTFIDARSPTLETLTKIVAAIANVPKIEERIPAGINEATTTVMQSFLAAGARTQSDFRELELHVAERKLAVHRIVIEEMPALGKVELYVRRIGSLVLGRSVKSEHILHTTLYWAKGGQSGDQGGNEGAKGGKGGSGGGGSDTEYKFFPQFVAAMKGEDEKFAKPTLKTPEHISDFCEKVRYFASTTAKLSRTDEVLMKRSMLIYFKYDNLVTAPENKDLLGACWTQENETFAQTLMQQFPLGGIEKFGTYPLATASKSIPPRESGRK